jgi:DNA mismatch endonuclease (patch repair protein)
MVDNLSPAARSYCMSRVRTRDTDLERLVVRRLRGRGFRFRRNDARLPGKPDIVFPEAKVAVFVDGDFWHGYRFPAWRDRVSPFWQEKIAKNRTRDQKNFRKLRRMGWRIVRLWQTQIRKDLDLCVCRITQVLNSAD